MITPLRGLRRPLVVQVLPAAPGGVRDFAECLGAEWSRRGVASRLVTLDRADARACSLSQRLVAVRGSGVETMSVLLHFSGYGYDARGLCLWLLEEVRVARNALGASLRLVTVFHELYASGAPWQSAFWIGGLQAHVARSLARLSDVASTNTLVHGDWLRAASAVPVRVRPVFSNVGEGGTVLPLAEREPGLVVFGSPSTRARALARLPAFSQELRAIGVRSIVEVGEGAASPHGPVREFPHEHIGRRDALQLGQLLGRHRFALIDYPVALLGKSGVFAAYAAHGCLVLNSAPAGVAQDGLQLGSHFVALGNREPEFSDAKVQQAIASAALGWYREHDLPKQATEFLSYLTGATAASQVDQSPQEASVLST